MPPVHKPLTIPPAAERDEKAMEMVRGWIAESGLHCTLNVGHWHNNSDIDERRAWGIMLADMARHIANAMHDMAELDPQISLQKVVAAFNEEIAKPTSEHSGEFPEEAERPEETEEGE